MVNSGKFKIKLGGDDNKSKLYLIPIKDFILG
jgi:hypothetical protein